ncbi:MAG: response regulator receiver [Labilithrix sp.]|nr:response regulator receiver [Labilithrix sp.]
MKVPPANVSSPRAWAASRSSVRVVVVATSAGGLHALRELLGRLPATFPAAIVVVQHRGPTELPLQEAVLQPATELRVRVARDGDILEAGHVYVCPAGFHAVTEHTLRLVDGPKMEHVRPSADVLLKSAALAYGDNAIGVVLTGKGTDGTLGAGAIVAAGGQIITQDPLTAAHPSMPAAATARGRPSAVLPLAEIAGALCTMLGVPPADPRPRPIAAGPRIRVLLVDDHRIILDGLKALLDAEPDLEVVGEAEDSDRAVALAAELAPDVVLMDLGLPGRNGVDATARIRALRPATQVVILTAFVDVGRAGEALGAGVLGILTKDAAYDHVSAAVRAAHAGHRYFSPRVASLVQRLPHGAPKP